MQERDPQALERTGVELLIRADRARCVVLPVRWIDARCHDEGLLARGDAIPQPRPHLRERLRRANLGADLLPPRGQLVEDRQVEVPVEGLGQRPGDRRRGREQEMRIEALLAQGRPLPHAEPMLLVDHGETQPLERDALDDEGVCPDDHIELARREPREDVAAIGGPDAGREQSHRRAAACVEHRERAEVLLGEQLRRGHQRDLGTGCDRDPRGERGHHGLARTDVALEESRHGDRACEVGPDLRDRGPLARGERERQRADPAADLVFGGGERGRPRVPLPTRPPLGQAELEREQLVEREPAAPFDEPRLRRWEVDLLQRLRKGQELAPIADGRWERVRDLRYHRRPLGAALHRGVEPAPQVSLLQSFGEPVHRDHPSGVHPLGVGRFDVRARELDRGPVERRLAGEPDQLPLAEALFDELPAEPRRAHPRGGMIRGIDQLDLGQQLAARGAPLADPADDRLGGLLLPHPELLERLDLGEVEMAGRKVPEEIADGADAEPLEEPDRLVPDARQRPDLQVEAGRATPRRR